MIEGILKSIIPETTISSCVKNTQYNFEIKLAHSPDWNYQLLFTDGLSNSEQAVKEGYESFKKIELYFLLPDYWDIKAIDWPINWLEKIAALPQKNATWFGPGDTIPAGNPPEVLSDRFPANHFMLVEPILTKEALETARFKESGIQFFGIVPICQPELDYKIRNSATVLLSRLQKKGHSEKLDLFRTSVCRKRVLGF